MDRQLAIIETLDEQRAALARAPFDLPADSPTRRLMWARVRARLGRDPTPADVTVALTDGVYPVGFAYCARSARDLRPRAVAMRGERKSEDSQWA